MKIQDISGRIYKILPVINGNHITDEVLNNVLEIYFSDELKIELKKQLLKYNQIFNNSKLPNENLNLQRGTYIIGPYSSGKSHIALFLSLLLGLDAKFTNIKKKKEIPNVREKCWDILFQAFSSNEIKNMIYLRKSNFVTLYITLTDHLTQWKLENVIIDSFNESRAAKINNIQLGLKLTEINTKAILKVLKSEPDELYYYNKLSSKEDKNKFLITFAEKHELAIKHKSFSEFAEELQKFINQNNFHGIIIFLDEFYRYFIEKSDTEKLHIGSVLQTFSSEIQPKVKLALLPITQVEMTGNDQFLEQVNRRFDRFPISYRNAEKLIHKRLIPEFNEQKLKKLIQTNPIHLNKTDFSFQTVKTVYPFCKRTIDSLISEVGKYTNNTKGVLSYSYTALIQNVENNALNLITADTLFDYFISGLESPELEGFERWQTYQNIERNYLKKIENESEFELTRKILKTLLFCTSRATTWSREDFQSHFFLNNIKFVNSCLDNLIKFIQEKSNNCVSSDINNEIFYYNPGVKQDLNKFIKTVDRCLIEEEILKQFWKENLNSDDIEEIRLIMPRELFIKAYKVHYLIDSFNTKNEIDEIFSILSNDIDEDEIVTYEFEEEVIDAVFLIDSLNIYEDEIIKYFNTGYYKQLDDDFKKNLKSSFIYVIPSPIPSESINKVRNYYARKILFHILKAFQKKKNLQWSYLKNKINNKLLNQTEISQRINLLKTENDETLANFSETLENSIGTKESLGAKSSLFNLSDIISLRKNLLKKGRIYRKLRWNKYSYDNIDDGISNIAESIIYEKYSFLNESIFRNTKKFYGTGLFNWLKDYIGLIISDNFEFTLSNNLKKIATSTFIPLGIFKKGKKNSYFFNRTFNSKRPHFEVFYDILSQEEPFEISSVLKAYMQPPYGFPKSFTLSLILFLIKINIFELETMNGIVKIDKYLETKGRNKNKEIKKILEDLVQNCTLVIPKILTIEEIKYFKIFLSLLSPLIENENINRKIEKTLNTDFPTTESQKDIIEIFEKSQLFDKIIMLKEEVSAEYERFLKWISSNFIKNENFNEEITTALFYTKKIKGNDLFIWLESIFDKKNEDNYHKTSNNNKLKNILKCIKDPLVLSLNSSIFQCELRRKVLVLKHLFSLIEKNQKSKYSLLSSFTIQIRKFFTSLQILENYSIISDFSNKDVILKLIKNPGYYLEIITNPEFDLESLKHELKSFNSKISQNIRNLHTQYNKMLKSCLIDEFELEESKENKFLNFLNNLRLINNQKEMNFSDILADICSEHNYELKYKKNFACCEYCTFDTKHKFDYSFLGLKMNFIQDFEINTSFDFDNKNLTISKIKSKLQKLKNSLIDSQIKAMCKLYIHKEQGLLYKLQNYYSKRLKDKNINLNEILQKIKFHNQNIHEIIQDSKIINFIELIGIKFVEILVFIETLNQYQNSDAEKKRKLIKNLNDLIVNSEDLIELISMINNQNLSKIDQIIKEYELLKLDDLIYLNFQDNLNKKIKNRINSNFLSKIKEDGKSFIIFQNQRSNLDTIINLFKENQESFNYFILGDDKVLSSFDSKENLFFEWEQIGYYIIEYQKDLEIMVQRMFPNCYFIGDRNHGRNMYDKSLWGKKLHIYENKEEITHRVGLIQIKYGMKKVNFF